MKPFSLFFQDRLDGYFGSIFVKTKLNYDSFRVFLNLPITINDILLQRIFDDNSLPRPIWRKPVNSFNLSHVNITFNLSLFTNFLLSFLSRSLLNLAIFLILILSFLYLPLIVLFVSLFFSFFLWIFVWWPTRWAGITWRRAITSFFLVSSFLFISLLFVIILLVSLISLLFSLRIFIWRVGRRGAWGRRWATRRRGTRWTFLFFSFCFHLWSRCVFVKTKLIVDLR